MLLLFFDISGGELLVILAAVFVVFGPKKVPEIARQIGKGMNELKKATSDITREFQEGADQVKKEVSQIKNTVEVSNQRLNDDFIAGPAEFEEDKKVTALPETETTKPTNPDAGITPGTPEGTVPRT